MQLGFLNYPRGLKSRHIGGLKGEGWWESKEVMRERVRERVREREWERERERERERQRKNVREKHDKQICSSCTSKYGKQNKYERVQEDSLRRKRERGVK